LVVKYAAVSAARFCLWRNGYVGGQIGWKIGWVEKGPGDQHDVVSVFRFGLVAETDKKAREEQNKTPR
jgi:hypothetical protein